MSQEKFDEAWTQWSDLVFSAVDMHIPKVNRRGANNPPWITREIASSLWTGND
jgi:hypothetical protein